MILWGLNAYPDRERALAAATSLVSYRLRVPHRIHVTFDGNPVVPFDSPDDHDPFWGLSSWTLTDSLGRNRGNAAALVDLARQVRDTDDWVVVSHAKTWLSDYSIIEGLIDIPRYAPYDDEWDCVLLDEGDIGILKNPVQRAVCAHLMLFRARCFKTTFQSWDPYPPLDKSDMGNDGWFEVLLHDRIRECGLRIHRLGYARAKWGSNTVVNDIDGTGCTVLSSNDPGDWKDTLETYFDSEDIYAISYAQEAWDREVKKIEEGRAR